MFGIHVDILRQVGVIKSTVTEKKAVPPAAPPETTEDKAAPALTTPSMALGPPVRVDESGKTIPRDTRLPGEAATITYPEGHNVISNKDMNYGDVRPYTNGDAFETEQAKSNRILSTTAAGLAGFLFVAGVAVFV